MRDDLRNPFVFLHLGYGPRRANSRTGASQQKLQKAARKSIQRIFARSLTCSRLGPGRMFRNQGRRTVHDSFAPRQKETERHIHAHTHTHTQSHVLTSEHAKTQKHRERERVGHDTDTDTDMDPHTGTDKDTDPDADADPQPHRHTSLYSSSAEQRRGPAGEGRVRLRPD